MVFSSSSSLASEKWHRSRLRATFAPSKGLHSLTVTEWWHIGFWSVGAERGDSSEWCSSCVIVVQSVVKWGLIAAQLMFGIEAPKYALQELLCAVKELHFVFLSVWERRRCSERPNQRSFKMFRKCDSLGAFDRWKVLFFPIPLISYLLGL